MTLFRSILYVAIFYPLSFFYVAFASLLLPLGQPAMIFAARSWAWFHRFCITVLLGQKVRVIGKMPEGPFLYVFKHESMFETIDMLCLFRQPAIVAKAELTRIPLWGRLAVAHGIIPVERQAGARALRAMMKAATQALADGRPICLFPEGTRTTHGERPPLRSGFAGLYKMLKVPVIPVAVDSGRLSPRGKFMKRPGLITFHVGETIPPGLPREEAEARVHAAINAINRRPL
ncbi:lysophospholipid acyltransferase family protein [Rhizorhapis suberifaciens]|uniref:1-acyl-sn-glycerol-3-phosphate acyltransferase n=1 Tax=Rhizorhapis suberifaciens TaxID=13656 RepID=A0A840HS62_9SPHN|nr:lysophospholipid acyltransferase family protein [Rhizorhapis suberifaciens]MBB4640420.1 1-acyl-sn-glycerol-3-phosphate acyltransferase [Rhizorhapis suberifaciens]